MTTPIQRLARLLDEGARFMVQIPGHAAIDLTPDVIAALEQVQTATAPVKLTPVQAYETEFIGGKKGENFSFDHPLIRVTH